MNRKMLGTYKAFTLIELIIVVVILGILAGLALPQFGKTKELQHQADAELQLKSIHAANQIYNVRTGLYWPPDGADYDVTNINTELRLSIIETGMTYNCTGTDGSTFTCTAVRSAPAPSFTITITEAPISSTNPDCTAGACP